MKELIEAGKVKSVVETGLYAILNSLATDEVYELEVEDYDDIPLTDR